MKTTVVVFTKNNARILTNPLDLQIFESNPSCAINPSLTKVVGVSPHYWKLVDGEILPMDSSERKARDFNIKVYGADNNHLAVITPPSPHKPLAPVIVIQPTPSFFDNHADKVAFISLLVFFAWVIYQYVAR